MSPYIWCQIFGDKSFSALKKETIIQDLLDFLGLSQNQLAEFFNISRTLFTRSALGSRKFPFRLNQRRLDMLKLMARMKAEFPDLTPLDLAWIQKETDKITPHLSEDPAKEQKQWELKMLLLELKELNDK